MQRRIPETSIEAYRHALESGLLKRLQFEIIEYYCEHDCDEGVTCLEMLDIIARAKGTNAWKIQQNYQKAISKLKDLGVLEPLEKRPCMASTSGRVAHPLRITGKMPIKRARPKSKDERIRELEGRVHYLERELEKYRFRELKSGGNLSLF